MKVYKVKVNGKVYEVELEAVTENNESIKAAAPAAAAAPALPALLWALFDPLDCMSHAATLGTEKYMKITAIDTKSRRSVDVVLMVISVSMSSAEAIMSGMWDTNWV